MQQCPASAEEKLKLTALKGVNNKTGEKRQKRKGAGKNTQIICPAESGEKNKNKKTESRAAN